MVDGELRQERSRKSIEEESSESIPTPGDYYLNISEPELLYGIDPEFMPTDKDVINTLRKYLKQVCDSEGFDIHDFPGMIDYVTNVVPYQVVIDRREERPERYERVMFLTEMAMAVYNKKMRTKFRVLKLDKVNLMSAKVLTYYVTFSAQDGKTATTRSFQAKVLDDTIEGEEEVIFCRQKPEC